MSRIPTSVRTLGSAASLLLLTLASTAHAATYTDKPVAKSEWTTSTVPSYIDMYIALPATMPAKPPILVNIHSCGNNAGGQWSYDGFAPLRAAMDSVGFIMILPQQSRNCWNVGAPESLKHGGGGDTGAIVQMVQYALKKYNGDPTRVYVMGGSGGGMCTQALLAVYPEIFKAGHERAGVAAGCWAEGYDDGMQWSASCAGGSVNKTAAQWGDYVRAINPMFTGHRPRIQLNHGNADETINFKNLGESIEQWTNVLGLDATPTSTDKDFKGTAKTSTSGAVTYNRSFWKDACGFTVMEAWEALGQKHGMGYESEAILKWFGLDAKRDQDPWDAACGGASPAPSGSSSTKPAPSASGSGAAVVSSSSAAPVTPPPSAAPSAAAVASTPVVAATTKPVTGSSTPVPAASTPVVAVTAANTGAPAVSMAAPAASGPETNVTIDGCGCNTVGRATGKGVPWALVALGMLVLSRRRNAI